MADTTVTCTVSPCTVVIQFDFPLANLSIADSLLIAGAIVGCWAVGMAYRVVIQLVNDGISTKESES